MVEKYVSYVIQEMEARKVVDNAAAMINYMKGNFDYFGVKSPLRKQIFREANLKFNVNDRIDLIEISNKLWSLPQRELQYVALDLLGKKKRLLIEEDLPWIESLIISKSWWDSVDAIAPNLAGHFFNRNRDLLHFYVQKWRSNDNLWLMRSSLICQLRLKETVDHFLLFETIDYLQGTNEFFINKAAGWALRQYSKFEPQRVRSFIEARDLPRLVVREGSKYL